MDIAGDRKGLSAERDKFIDTLYHEESIGVIVGRVAFIDWLLGETLACYYCDPERRPSFLDSIISRLSLDIKITALAELSLEGEAKKLRDEVCIAVRPMQQLRNKAAHVSGIKKGEIDRLYSDKAKRELLANFPKGINAAASEIQERLFQLALVPGFARGGLD